MHTKKEKIMKETLEKIWNDYFADECARMESKQEKALAKQAINLHNVANDLLSKEQRDAIEKYVDILCDINTSYARKAFVTGCKFATSFLFEARNFEKK